MTVVPNQEMKRAPLDLEGNKCRLSATALHVPAQDEPHSKRLLCLHTISLHFEEVVLYRSANAKELCWPHRNEKTASSLYATLRTVESHLLLQRLRLPSDFYFEHEFDLYEPKSSAEARSQDPSVSVRASTAHPQ